MRQAALCSPMLKQHCNDFKKSHKYFVKWYFCGVMGEYCTKTHEHPSCAYSAYIFYLGGKYMYILMYNIRIFKYSYFIFYLNVICTSKYFHFLSPESVKHIESQKVELSSQNKLKRSRLPNRKYQETTTTTSTESEYEKSTNNETVPVTFKYIFIISEIYNVL